MRVAILGPICRDKIKIDDEVFEQMGSPAFYIGNALASLGVGVTVFGTYGDEPEEWIRNNFPGVKVVHVPAEETLVFTNSYSRSNPDECHKEATYFKNTITVEHLKKYSFDEFDYVIFGPLFYDNTPAGLFEYFPRKKVVYGNFGMFRYPDEPIYRNPANLVNVLRHVEYAFLSEGEANFVAGRDDVFESGRYLQAQGARNVVATKGSKGALLFTGPKCHFTPAFPPGKLVDAVGAGDTFLAGFIKALELFKEPIKQLEFAAMCATMKIEKKGPLTNNVEEVLSRLRQH